MQGAGEKGWEMHRKERLGNSVGKTDQHTWRFAKEHSSGSLPFSLSKDCQFPKQAFGRQSSWA